MMTPSHFATSRLITPLRPLFKVCFLFVFPLLVCQVVFAAPPKTQVLEQKKQQVQIKIHKLQEKIRGHEDVIHTKENQEHYILKQLEDIDMRLAIAQSKVFKLELQIKEQHQKIADQETELRTVKTNNATIQNHLQKRLKAYYTTGQIDFLNIAFSTKTLPELITLQEAYGELIRYDKDIILSYRTTIQQLESSKRALTLEQDVLVAFLQQMQVDQNNLAATKKEKETLLGEIRNQKGMYVQAIKEMQEASDNLVDNLEEIQEQQYIANNYFLQKKGQLPPPVEGKIITRFLEEKENGLGIARKSLGIALKVVDGTPIRAIAGGKVVYAGYLRGYGNTVVIDHGYQYYTVTARIEKVACKKGTSIRLGSIIGISGDSATVIDDGLYFEIRHGKKSLDPLFWLDPNLLDVAIN